MFSQSWPEVLPRYEILYFAKKKLLETLFGIARYYFYSLNTLNIIHQETENIYIIDGRCRYASISTFNEFIENRVEIAFLSSILYMEIRKYDIAHH